MVHGPLGAGARGLRHQVDTRERVHCRVVVAVRRFSRLWFGIVLANNPPWRPLQLLPKSLKTGAS